MLRITASTSAAGARAYFDTELRKGDYYVKGHGIAGRWHGLGAELLGLSGEVTREQFHALTENQSPMTGEQLTPRTKDNRRVGYDFTFSAPKSISVLYAYTGDERVLDAFRSSVHETMAEIEGEMQTRVRCGGQSVDRATGNLVYADFVHFNSRPIDGISDPHLHCHAYVFNTTWDPVEERWKAGQFGGLKRDAPYYEAAFDARLAQRLEALGYATTRQGKGWELAGLERATIDKFSRRTTEIEAEAKERGIVSDRLKATLGAKTRHTKAEEIGEGYSAQAFLDRLSEAEIRALDRIAAGEGESGKGDPPSSARAAVDFALAHSFERQSVVSEKRLLERALRRGVGHVDVDSVRRELDGRAEVLRRDDNGQVMTTTRAVLAEEKAMIRFAREGRNACAPLVRDVQIQNPELGDDQQAAVTEILTSRDRVIALRGGAGTGKSWLAREAVDQIEATGKRVVMLAPSAGASRGVLRAEGFSAADTVARFLGDPKLQAQARGGVIWVDEAGLMGAQTMGRVFRAADQLGARVVLAGDTRQHGAVERGDAMRILETHGGLKPATLSTIRRQKSETYRAVVDAVQKGHHARGFQLLEDSGAVREILDRGERHAQIAKDYARGLQEGASVLAVAPAHIEARAVSEAIRAELKACGVLEGPAHVFETHRPLNLTEAEKSDAASYVPGQVVQFVQNARGIRRGARFHVLGRDDRGEVRIADAQGLERALPLRHGDRFEVYAQDKTELTVGDRIRITQNGFAADKKRLNNGDICRIAGFTRGGDLVLDNGKRSVLPRDFGHFAHGYVTTSHASQGRTVDRVLIAQGAESLPATSAEQFYVSVSRGRESVTIYTDDVADLRDAVTRSATRTAAVELVPAETRERAAFLQRVKARAWTLAERARDVTHDLIEKYARPRRERERGLEPDFG